MSVAKPLWVILVFLMAVLLILLRMRAAGNIIIGVLMVGSVLVIATVIAAGLEEPE
jgi:hypothetical protein